MNLSIKNALDEVVQRLRQSGRRLQAGLLATFEDAVRTEQDRASANSLAEAPALDLRTCGDAPNITLG